MQVCERRRYFGLLCGYFYMHIRDKNSGDRKTVSLKFYPDKGFGWVSPCELLLRPVPQFPSQYFARRTICRRLVNEGHTLIQEITTIPLRDRLDDNHPSPQELVPRHFGCDPLLHT